MRKEKCFFCTKNVEINRKGKLVRHMNGSLPCEGSGWDENFHSQQVTRNETGKGKLGKQLAEKFKTNKRRCHA